MLRCSLTTHFAALSLPCLSSPSPQSVSNSPCLPPPDLAVCSLMCSQPSIGRPGVAGWTRTMTWPELLCTAPRTPRSPTTNSTAAMVTYIVCILASWRRSRAEHNVRTSVRMLGQPSAYMSRRGISLCNGGGVVRAVRAVRLPPLRALSLRHAGSDDPGQRRVSTLGCMLRVCEPRLCHCWCAHSCQSGDIPRASV